MQGYSVMTLTNATDAFSLLKAEGVWGRADVENRVCVSLEVADARVRHRRCWQPTPEKCGNSRSREN